MRPCGGDEEVRTPDPLRARQVLSQLSYTPELFTLRALKMSSDTLKIKQRLDFRLRADLGCYIKLSLDNVSIERR